MHIIRTSSLRRWPSTTSAVLLGCAALALGACSNEDNKTILAPTLNIPKVVITPGSTTLRPGATQQLTAEVRDGASGTPIGGATVVWSSADVLVARVSSSGLVTVVGPGTAGVTAKYANAIGVAAITVLGPIVGVTVSAPLSSLTVGNSVQLAAQAIDGSGVPQAREVTYTSSAPTVFTVSGTGLATAVSPGTATITATSEGKTASVTLTALAFVPVDRVTITLSLPVIPVGASLLASVTTLSAAGTNLGRPVTFLSSAPTIATVSATGLVTMIAPGAATITATSEGQSATVTTTSVITSGTSYTINGPTNSDFSFYVSVPAGATSVLVTLNGGTGDPDLYVWRAGAATATCSSEADGPGETCTVPTTGVAGLYRIRVLGYTAYAGTTLRATVTP